MTPILARQRPDRSLERLYKKHAGDVYRYALVVLRNEADAEDVTQTTFMNAYRALERGEKPRTPQNWLIAIAHNVCRQRFRQSQRRPNEIALNEELAEAPLEEEERVSAEDIRRALGHLAFNQRAALVMRELEGRSYVEIAEILGLSVSAVETLLFRARRALREQLDGALTCHEAELAISRQLDGRLPRAERGSLRAHLRACPDCATVARRQRAQRTAFKALAAVPLPSSLASLFGGGGAAVGTGVAMKAAAVLATGALVGGLGYEGVRHTDLARRGPKLPAVRAVPPTPVPAVVSAFPPVRRSRFVSHAAATGRRDEAPVSRARHQAAKVNVRAHPARAGFHPAHPVHPVHPVQLAHPLHPIQPTHPVRPAHPTHPVHPAHAAQARSSGKPLPKDPKK